MTNSIILIKQQLTSDTDEGVTKSDLCFFHEYASYVRRTLRA